MKRRSALLGIPALLSSAGALFSCGPTEIPDRRRQLLESWGTRTLLPLYAEFETRLTELDQRARELVLDPSPDTLEAARSVWWAAREPWKQADVFAFGPYSDDPFRLGARIDFWPVRPDSIENVLASEEPLRGEEALALGASTKGLPVVEYLLYQTDIDVGAEFAAVPRRGEYLLVLTADLVAAAAEIQRAWDPEQENYLAVLTEAGRGSREFESLAAALGEVVNRMAFVIEDTRDNRLGRPLGNKSSGNPQPDKIESRYSGRAIDDIRDSLNGLERFFFGNAEAGELGLDGYLKWRGKDYGALLRSRLESSRDALSAIDLPLAEAVFAEQRAVQSAIDRLSELQRALQVDVINALALTVTFVGNDGD